MAHDESKETFNVKYRLNLYAVCTKFVNLLPLLLLLLPPPPLLLLLLVPVLRLHPHIDIYLARISRLLRIEIKPRLYGSHVQRR